MLMKLYKPFGVLVQWDRKLVCCTAEEIHILLLNTWSMKRTASERFVMDFHVTAATVTLRIVARSE